MTPPPQVCFAVAPCIPEILFEKGAQVLVIDDLLATGGTMKAACEMIEKAGGKVVECAFIVDLPDLKGREKLKDYKVFSLVEFEGE